MLAITDISKPITGRVVRITRDKHYNVLGIDSSANLVVITGRQSLAQIISDPVATTKRIDRMAWGDQGHNPLNPSEPLVVLPEDTALNHELLRKNLLSYAYPTLTSVEFIARINGDELVGSGVSEAILLATDGTGFAINHFGLMYHAIDIIFEFRWTIYF